MNFGAIEDAFEARLLTLPDVPPIAWPNKDFTPSGTYLEFRISPNDVLDPVISGGYEYEIGIALVTVVTPANEFSKESNTIAQAIKAHFPKGLRLTSVGTTVVINAPVSRGTPFPDGTYFRQPLRISYITE